MCHLRPSKVEVTIMTQIESSGTAPTKESQIRQSLPMVPRVTTTGLLRIRQVLLDNDGRLPKKSAAEMFSGTFEQKVVRTIEEFGEIIAGLGPRNAVLFGVFEGHQAGRIVTKSAKTAHPGALSRTRKDVGWADGPGIMFLDYSPPQGRQAAPAGGPGRDDPGSVSIPCRRQDGLALICLVDDPKHGHRGDGDRRLGSAYLLRRGSGRRDRENWADHR